MLGLIYRDERSLNSAADELIYYSITRAKRGINQVDRYKGHERPVRRITKVWTEKNPMNSLPLNGQAVRQATFLRADSHVVNPRESLPKM